MLEPESGSSPHIIPPFTQEVPTGWITGIFNKAGNGHAKQFELTKEELEKRARASRWLPWKRAEWAAWGDSDPSSYIHNALQQLGVGIGHELYGKLMREINARKIITQEKKKIVKRLGLDELLNKHLINVASLNDLLAIYFLNRLCLIFHSRWGKAMMDKAENRVAADNNYEEARLEALRQGKVAPPRRWRPRNTGGGRTGTTAPTAFVDPVIEPLTPLSTEVALDSTTPVTPASRDQASGTPPDTQSGDRPTRKRSLEPDNDKGADGQDADPEDSDSSEGLAEFFRKRREQRKAERKAAWADRVRQRGQS